MQQRFQVGHGSQPAAEPRLSLEDLARRAGGNPEDGKPDREKENEDGEVVTQAVAITTIVDPPEVQAGYETAVLCAVEDKDGNLLDVPTDSRW